MKVDSGISIISINSKTQYGPLLSLSSRLITYAPSFILGKLSLEKK